MKLTVLGNTGAYPGAGGACSGYLLEEGHDKIVLDMGAGTLANLQTVCSFKAITAIVLTHLHWDHVSDLYVLQYALEMAHQKITLYAPQNPEEDYKRLTQMDAFDVKPITEALTFSIGQLKFSFCEMKHPVQDFAVKIDNGKWTFMYTGDTALCDALKSFASGTHAMLCDASFIEKEGTDKHLSVYEAVDVANAAGVRHLVLTHFRPDVRPQKYFEIANDLFKGRVSKAEIMSVINL
ncbi:MAG: MBL fold metallo-hydrolase [Eubacteriaceae bacterium]|nr:MBL fold metallo-hydrolase [Eubacteriaceae bacterium]MDD4507363.1 MBL fold metallo-hydrolase [Eubacteriaceae bacterium]